MTHTPLFFLSYIYLYRLLRTAQHCCHFVVGKVANQIQEILHSKDITRKTE